MKTFKLYLILLSFFLSNNFVMGQPGTKASTFDTGIKNFQAPNVSTLQTYVSTPVSLYTGTPSISIPIYDIAIGKVDIPLNLSYHISNVKPNTQPGIVGLGWNLALGGYITRIQKDFMDEYQSLKTDNGKLDLFLGILGREASRTGHGNWSSEDWAFGTLANNKIYTDDYRSLEDYAPDEFLFNFLGYSGSFYRDHTGVWKVKSNTHFEVRHELIKYCDTRPQIANGIKKAVAQAMSWANRQATTFHKFYLTAPDGTEFIFGGKEAIDYSIDYTNQDGLAPPVATTWYLSQIKDTSGHEINFNYEVTDPLTDGNVSFTGQSNFMYPASGVNVSFQLIMPVLLKSIVADKQTIATFEYMKSMEKPFAYKSNDGWDNYYRINLLDNKTMYKVYLNSYSDVKRNLLKSIHVNNLFVYNFQYTQNSSERSKLIALEKQTLSDNVVNKEKYGFKYNSQKFPDYNTGHYDHLGFYNGKDFTPFYTQRIVEKFTLQDAQAYEQARAADRTGKYVCAEMLEEIQFPTGGKTAFVYEPNLVKGTVSIDRASVTNNEMYPGGIRIKQIKMYTDANKIAQIKSYYYVHDFDPKTKTGRLSGILSFTPQYLYTLSMRSLALSGSLQKPLSPVNRIYMFSSRSTNPGWYNSEEQLVGYSEVVECDEDPSGKINGYTKYTYTNFESNDGNHYDEPAIAMTNNKDYTPYINRSIYYDYITHSSDYAKVLPLTPYTSFTPFSSRSLERGKLLSLSVYDAANNLKKKEESYYERSSNDYVRSTAMTITPNPEAPDALPGKGQFGIGGSYKIYVYNYHLTTKCFYTRENDEATVLRINYTYNNVGLITEEEQVDKIHTYSTKIKYLVDLMDEYKQMTSVSIPNASLMKVYDVMKRKNMLALPIEKTEMKNGKVIGAEVMTYQYANDMVLPWVYYKLDTSIPLSDYTSVKITTPHTMKIDDRCTLKTTYWDYDKYGNPTCVNSDGKEYCYLWSYYGKYIVAKIQNTTYDDLKKKLSFGVSAISGMTPEPFWYEINNLRHILPNAFIETYKYKPFVGVTEFTDSRGVTTYYTYDGFGRLVETFIKENDNKVVLQANKYNYLVK